MQLLLLPLFFYFAPLWLALTALVFLIVPFRMHKYILVNFTFSVLATLIILYALIVKIMTWILEP